MKKLAILMTLLLNAMGFVACASEPQLENGQAPDTGEYFNGKKVLVAYFSWGGTTRRMAEAIQETTGGTLFEIVPVNPYPTEYTPCTEVALEERDSDARPPIKDQVNDWDSYDVIFIGCPVWWHTAPMIINTFCESYGFEGKTVVPFCTYAATYRDETLQKIVDLIPAAKHLGGLGTTVSTSGVKSWIESISKESGISMVENDNMHQIPDAIYNLNGVKMPSSDLLSGLYIVRNGNYFKKVLF